jgi:F-type H+-transporting ATPase subunit delta
VRDTTVGARYAKALHLVPEKRSETIRALEDLHTLGELMKPGSRVGALLATPQVLLSDKRKVLAQVLEGRSLRSVALFVDLLLRKKRLREFDTIVLEFESLVEKQQGILRAQVTSAVPLLDAERDRLHAELERTTGKRIRLTADVDPSLLGGALVRIGDRVVDRTVKSLLEAIHQRLMIVSV